MLTLLLILGVLALLGLAGWSCSRLARSPRRSRSPWLRRRDGRWLTARTVAVSSLSARATGCPTPGVTPAGSCGPWSTVEQDENGVTVTRVDPRFSDGDPPHEGHPARPSPSARRGH